MGQYVWGLYLSGLWVISDTRLTQAGFDQTKKEIDWQLSKVVG